MSPTAQGPSAKRRLITGIVCVVIGVALGITTLVLTLVAAFATDADIPLDGQPHTVSVESGDERLLFIHAGSGTSCTVVDPASGDQLPLDTVGPDITRNVNGVERVAAWEFTPTGDRVEVTCSGDSNVDAQVTPPIFTATHIALTAAGIIVAAVLLVLGIVLIITAVLRRSRARRSVGPPPGGPPHHP